MARFGGLQVPEELLVKDKALDLLGWYFAARHSWIIFRCCGSWTSLPGCAPAALPDGLQNTRACVDMLTSVCRDNAVACGGAERCR